MTTIEGLSPDSTHPVQQAWFAEQVPQCGYCQSGQIMAVAAYLKSEVVGGSVYDPKQKIRLTRRPPRRGKTLTSTERAINTA